MRKYKVRPIHRRTMLRAAGLTGIALALPPLEAMFTKGGRMVMNAQGQTGTAPKRLLIFWWGNGALMSNFTPATVGANWQKTPILEGLAQAQIAANPTYDAQADVNLLTGIGIGDILTVQNHAPNALAAFTGAAPIGAESAALPSVDKVAGDAIGKDTKVGYLPVAVTTRDAEKAAGRYSWNAAGQPVRPYLSPKSIWDEMFWDYTPPGQTPDPAVVALKARKQGILDYTKESINRLKSQLGQEDKQRLDQHLESIADVEKAMYAEALLCAPPGGQADDSEMTGNMDGVDMLPRFDILTDLSIMAMRCGLTNVVNFSHDPSGGNMVYPGMSKGDHDLSHSGVNGDPDPTGNYTALTRIKVSRLARLIYKLKQQDDVSGKLLDNCVVVALSEMSWGGGHTHENLPVIVAGGGMQTGKHLVFPCSGAKCDSYVHCQTGNTDLRRLWLTALQAVGAEISNFAGLGGTLTGLWPT